MTLRLPPVTGLTAVTFSEAAAPPATASPSQRTLEGLAVPFGAVARLNEWGPVTFDDQSLSWAGDVSRVKLLLSHDYDRPVGVATALRQDDAGLWATFSVAEGPAGDALLSEAADGRRDGLSVGVTFDDDFLTRWLDSWLEESTEPIRASASLREISAVSVPAYDDARLSRPAKETA